jgi:hypothetical protein
MTSWRDLNSNAVESQNVWEIDNVVEWTREVLQISEIFHVPHNDSQRLPRLGMASYRTFLTAHPRGCFTRMNKELRNNQLHLHSSDVIVS